MSRARVLLVDGNDDFLDGVVDWVAHDAQIEIVGRTHSGLEALERIEALHPDLVLMDVALPDLSGFEVARRTKARPEGPLVVLLSFHDNQAARLEAWAAGADGFVPKSETTTRLMPLVTGLLGRRHADPDAQDSIVPPKRIPPEEKGVS